MKEIQLELPFTLNDYGGIENVYYDQGPNHSDFFFSCYTPVGIKGLESEIIKEIRSFQGDEKDFQELRNYILCNKHLHSVIKYNLIHNLEMIYDEQTQRIRQTSTCLL